MVETLLAISILAISIGGGAKMVVMSSKLSDMSSDKNTAINLAKNRIERISVSDFNDFEMWRGTNVVSNAQGHPDPEGHFRINTEVTYPITNLLAEIVVQVHSKNRVTLQFDNAPEVITTRISNPEQTTE